MADKSKIEWTDATFNPWIGCTKVSPGCDNCYAEADFDHRKHWVKWGPGQQRKRTSPANWKKPLQWNAQPFYECARCGWRGHLDMPGAFDCVALGQRHEFRQVRRRVFCASLADVFDNEVPDAWRWDLFRLIRSTPDLDWLLLTKRIGNARKMLNQAASAVMEDFVGAPTWDREPWPNVWLGATIVNQEEADRDIPKLLQVPARVRFLSIEPMLGPIDLTPAYLPCPNFEGVLMDPTTGAYECCRKCDFTGISDEIGIDWVIAGGESGPNARPMHPQWVRSLRDQCKAAGVAFHFKQHGEWLATEFCTDEQADTPHKGLAYVRPDGSFHDGSAGVDFFGGDQETARVGKKAAGRLLDGVEHNGVPA